MGFDQFRHAGETKIIMHGGGWWRRCAVAGCTLAPIDPNRPQTDGVCRSVIVKEALGYMHDVALGMTRMFQRVDHVAEISEVGLIGADILGGVDRVEGDAEPSLALREAFAIDIREDDELVELLQIDERRGRIGKGRPISYGAAESAVIRLA